MISGKTQHYINFLNEENGIVGEKEFVLDANFLSNMIDEIERSRTGRLMYNKDYKRHWLDEFLKKSRKKKLMKTILDRVKSIREKEMNEDEDNGDIE